MSTERKILIVAGLLCMFGVAAGLMGTALAPFFNRPALFIPSAMLALLSAWLGSAIAEVLKKNPDA